MAEPKLLDQYRERLRVKHYSLRTEDAYLHWARRFLYFHGKRHPREMGGPEVEAFLTHLATKEKVAAATQNQALSTPVYSVHPSTSALRGYARDERGWRREARDERGRSRGARDERERRGGTWNVRTWARLLLDSRAVGRESAARPAGQVAYTVRSLHAPLHSRVCSRRDVFLHGCSTRTAPPMVDGAYRRAARGLHRRAFAKALYDERHRRIAGSSTVHLDAARGRCGFLITLACHQGAIRSCHRR